MKSAIINYTSCLIVFLFASCQKFLEIQPNDKFLEEDIFKNEQSINNTLNGIYINLSKQTLYGANMSTTTLDVLAQYYLPSYMWEDLAAYQYTTSENSARFALMWKSAYQAILNINTFIYNLEKSTVLEDEKRKMLLGEACGLRAFIHFDMLRLFGPVYAHESDAESIPYVTGYEPGIQPLLPAKIVLDSVLHDLERAEELLENDPIRKNGVENIKGDRPLEDFYKLRNRRMNYFAVIGLKARVFLYKGDLENAYLSANMVINEAGSFFPWTDPKINAQGVSNPDRVFSKEVLFGLHNYEMYSVADAYFSEDVSTNSLLTVEPNMLRSIYDNSQRDDRLRMNWSTRPDGRRMFVKYADLTDKSLPYRNFQPLLRISEMYYIAAEAEIEPSKSLAYINTVRTNRGLDDLGSSTNINSAIRNEYRKEFWGEGQLFFYYKRRGLTTIPSSEPGLNYPMNNNTYVIPLPINEINNR